MSNIFFKLFHNLLPGSKTYIAGLGLMGLGAYEISQGSMDQGLAHIAQGLALIGVRTAVTSSALDTKAAVIMADTKATAASADLKSTVIATK